MKFFHLPLEHVFLVSKNLHLVINISAGKETMRKVGERQWLGLESFGSRICLLFGWIVGGDEVVKIAEYTACLKYGLEVQTLVN